MPGTGASSASGCRSAYGKPEVDRLAACWTLLAGRPRSGSGTGGVRTNMVQKVLETTAGGCLQVENDSAFVVGGKTCWKQPRWGVTTMPA